MAEETKATSEGTGLPAEAKAIQASANPAGSIAVAEGKVDLNAVYVLPTGEKALGKDLMQHINRGKGYQQLQSQLDKTKAELDQTIAYAKQLEAEKQEREEKTRITQTFEELSQSFRKASPNDDDYGLNGDDTGIANPIDPKMFMQTIMNKFSEVEGSLSKKNEATIQSMIQEAISNLFQQQQQANQINVVAGNLDKINRDALTAMYSHYAETDPKESSRIFDEIILKENAMNKEQQDARFKAQQGIPDWQDHFFKAQELATDVGRLRGQLHVENEKAKAETESRGVLGNTLNSLSRQVTEKLPRFKTRKEWEEHHAKTMAEAKKLIDAHQTANKVR